MNGGPIAHSLAGANNDEGWTKREERLVNYGIVKTLTREQLLKGFRRLKKNVGVFVPASSPCGLN